MKRFRFKLQAVLTLREEAEQTAEQAYAKALQAERQSREKLNLAEAVLGAGEEIMRARIRNGARAQELDQMRVYAQFLAEEVALAARDLAVARQQTECSRQSLQKAMQERETLDRLRERQREAYDFEAARAEQKLLDEIGARSSQFRSGRETALQTL